MSDLKERMIDVGICLVTYNQQRYIKQAIESVIRQKTKYKYKLFIGDDCSLDDTLMICRRYKDKYPDIIELIESNENVGLVRNTQRILDRIVSSGIKYIAMLDGDDYWCDYNKLELQCNFLEQHLDFGLSFTLSAELYKDKLYKAKQREDLSGFISLQQAKKYPIPNNTVCFRTKLLSYIDFDDFVNRKFMSCDYAMYVVFSKYTKFKLFPICTAVTRRGHSSVSHSTELDKRIEYIDNDIAQFKYLGERFSTEIPFTEKDEKNHRDFMRYSLAVKYCNYEMVKDTLHQNREISSYKQGFLYKLKVLFSSNIVLFYLWCFVSRVHKKTRAI